MKLYCFIEICWKWMTSNCIKFLKDSRWRVVWTICSMKESIKFLKDAVRTNNRLSIKTTVYVTYHIQFCSIFFYQSWRKSIHLQVSMSFIQKCLSHCSRAILFNANSTTYVFLNFFESFRYSYFKTPSWKHLWWSLVEVYTVDQSTVF